MVHMTALPIVACSGPNAASVILEAQIYAETLLLISTAIAVLSATLAWFRPPAVLRSALMGGMLLVHPGIWMDAVHGDCGCQLTACSTIWTVVMTVCALLTVGLTFSRRNDYPTRQPFQFSMRTLLCTVTASCLWFGFYSMFGETFVTITFLLVYICGLAAVVTVWFWALVDCLIHDNRLRWPMIILLGSIPGGLLYIFFRRPRRIVQLGH